VYYDIIANQDLHLTCKIICNNKIVIQYAKLILSKFNIRTVGHLINEYKYPSCDQIKPYVEIIINHSGPLFRVLAARKNLTLGYNYRDGLPLESNRIVSCAKITTKLLRHRLLYNVKLSPLTDQSNLLKGIRLPKERELIYLIGNNAILSNEKLHDMKLVASPDCPICQCAQSIIHIFDECSNSVKAYKILREFYEKHKVEDWVTKKNLDSLIKRLLYLNRNKFLHSSVIEITLANRVSDLEVIDAKRNRNSKQLGHPLGG